MKILYPVEVFYPSQAGGAANSVYCLTKHVKAHGFEPTIVASDKGINGQMPLNRWLDTDAGRAVFVRTRFLYVPVRQTITSLRHFLRADVVHLSSVFYPTAFLTAFAAKMFGKKIAWSPRGELTDYALNYSGGRKRPILWAIRKFIGAYPVFHSTSADETENIRIIFGDNVRVHLIPNYFEIEPQLNRSDGNYLLHIGRIHPKKAIDNLIRALTHSQEFLNSSLKLKIAGKGKPEYERKLKDLVSEMKLNKRVTFVGQVEGAEKTQLFADARFTIMPSHTENFGNVVLESLAQGTPVIASIYSPWEALQKEKIGFWTDNMPEELAATIDAALRLGPEEYERYRDRSREFVLREFEIENHIDEWLVFYSNFR